MPIGLHVKHPLFLSDFNETGILSTDFRKMLEYQISLKIRSVGPSSCMRRGGRTDMTKLIVTFRDFAKAPKNYYTYEINGLRHYTCVLKTKESH